MTTKTAWYAEVLRRHGHMTELNLATSARYRACHGRHVPSGQTVVRPFPIGQFELPICARCGVPYGRTQGWNGLVNR